MTAIAEDLDLSWVTFTAPVPGDSCGGWFGKECPLEAVALSWWETRCDCDPNPARLCAGHRDTLRALEAADPGGWWECSGCGSLARLIRIEPIK
jgi:hypothetical protein